MAYTPEEKTSSGPKYDSYRLSEHKDWAGRLNTQIVVTYSNGSHSRRFGNGFPNEASALKYLKRFHPELLLVPRKD